MQVLLCHNHYQQPGGEDQSFDDEARLLESRGHSVTRYTVHNDVIKEMGGIEVTARTMWNRGVYRKLRELIRQHRPAVMHCTNIFPLISPAAYYAARSEGVPVVQSLRNYRLLCANALFLRDGKACEDCLGKRLALPALRHRCYRGSLPATAVVTTMVGAHRFLGTWGRAVDLYFTPSEFARRKFIEGGFPADKVMVKPNFVYPDPGAGTGAGGYAIFVGRLSEEKGVATLLEAWVRHTPAIKLKIVGDGPMAPQVREAVAACPSIEWVGRRPIREAYDLIGDAAILISPSVAYETFGRTIVEGYAKGTPVISSDSGASAELIVSGVTGVRFRTGMAAELAQRVAELTADPVKLAQMRESARREYLEKYNADANYGILSQIYQRAIAFRADKHCTSPRVTGAYQA